MTPPFDEYAILVMMKIYLDACCLNRPFDNQGQPRIRLETEAISIILEKLHQSEWEWVGSEILLYELGQNPDLENRQQTLSLASLAQGFVETTAKVLSRAEEIEKTGFDSYDALHLSSAEFGNADVFLTTDDQILKVATRKENLFPFAVENPVKWLGEVLK
jgi:hypothetical protein